MVRRKLSFLVTLSMLSLSSSAMAKMSDLAFKEVRDSLFKKDKEMNSPILGQTALQTSLIANIRFNGPFNPGYNQRGERDYTKDKSDDPLWNLTNIFFPSNNGVLGDVFDSYTNFASYVHKPEVVARLLNYANQIRESLDQSLSPIADSKKENKMNKEEKEIDSLAPQEMAKTFLPLLHKESKSLKPGQIKSKILVPLLTSIKNSILEEHKKNTLYPKGVTEQFISAFSSYHFNTQDDIWDEMGKMDDSLVNKSAVASANPHSLLTREDIHQISLKDEPFDMSEVFALASASIFSSPTPYKEGVDLLNNGTAEVYNRTLNKFEKETLADCVETAIRHILNLALYNSETHRFETAAIKPRKTDSLIPDPTEQLIAFFQKQQLEQVNQGDPAYRSAFNSIVADLNIHKYGPEIRYNRPNNNEIFPGFINMTHVLSRILNIDLEATPQEKIDQGQWVKRSLEKILNQISPQRKYTVNYYDSKETGNDIFGTLSIEANDSMDTPLFSFDVYSRAGHAETRNLKSKTQQERIQESLTTHQTKIKPNTAEESLWLLFPTLQKEMINHPLYKLFSKPLSDNAARIHFLEVLPKIDSDILKPNLGKINLMLANVLDGVSWEDPEILKQIRYPLFRLSSKNDFVEILAKKVKGILIDKPTIEYSDRAFPKFQKFQGAQFMIIENSDEVLDFSHLGSPLKSIKKISNAYAENPKGIRGLEYVPNLEELTLRYTDLSVLEFDVPMKALKKIDMAYAKELTTIKGLEYVPNLEELDLRSQKSMSVLEFKGPMPALRKLNFSFNLGSFSIIGIENLSALDELKLDSYNHVTIKWKSRSSQNEFEKLKPNIIPGTVRHEYEEDEH